MSSVRGVVVVAAGLLVVAGCASGNRETDREAETLAVAISHPRQDSASGFANAALATSLGKSSGFSVLEMRDLKADKLTDPLAQLVFRIHHEPQESDWGDPVTACYSLDFNYYGAIGEPSRITCPDNAGRDQTTTAGAPFSRWQPGQRGGLGCECAPRDTERSRHPRRPAESHATVRHNTGRHSADHRDRRWRHRRVVRNHP